MPSLDDLEKKNFKCKSTKKDNKGYENQNFVKHKKWLKKVDPTVIKWT